MAGKMDIADVMVKVIREEEGLAADVMTKWIDEGGMTADRAWRAFQELVEDLEMFKEEVDEIDEVLSLVIRSHLRTEQLLEEAIRAELPNADELLNNGDLTYYQKILLVVSFDVVEQQITDGLKILNKIRNKYAHDFSYRISKKDARNLGRTQGKRFTEVEAECPGDPEEWCGRTIASLCGQLSGLVRRLVEDQERSD